MDIRLCDPSPAVATYVTRTAAGNVAPVKPGLAPVAKVAVLGTRLPRPDGFAPPLTPLTTSRGPSHAISAGA